MRNEPITAGQLVEWIGLERQCCPFFGFQVLWEPQNGPVWLTIIVSVADPGRHYVGLTNNVRSQLVIADSQKTSLL